MCIATLDHDPVIENGAADLWYLPGFCFILVFAIDLSRHLFLLGGLGDGWLSGKPSRVCSGNGRCGSSSASRSNDIRKRSIWTS